jgi:hypothetical protein
MPRLVWLLVCPRIQTLFQIGTPGRDIEAEDWTTYDSLSEQLWKTRARSICDRQSPRCRPQPEDRGEPHSVLKESYGWNIIRRPVGGAVMSAQSKPSDTGRKILEYRDRPAPGCLILDVMREGSRRVYWAALMIDVDPDDLKNCTCDFPALFYVHPKDYRPGLVMRVKLDFAFRVSTRAESSHGAL